MAKATQNPVADLVALPFQFNFNNGGGLDDRTQLNLNFQPVLPISLTESFTVIARTVVPIFLTGLGDTQAQLFLTPARPGALVWGFGPVLSLPTATMRSHRTGSWGMGPNLVLVTSPGAFVLGVLANQVWTVKDQGGDPKVDLLTVQPFVNYNFGAGWAITFAPLITANWEAVRKDTWMLPLGLGLSRTLVFQRQPMSLGVHYYRNVVRPDDGPANQLRAVMSFLFPTKRG